MLFVFFTVQWLLWPWITKYDHQLYVSGFLQKNKRETGDGIDMFVIKICNFNLFLNVYLHPNFLSLKIIFSVEVTSELFCPVKNDQFSSVSQSCLTLCDPMDCSMPGLPVYHQLLELTQTHVHRVGDTIQPSHPLLSPSPPAFNLSQHQGLF